MIRLAHPRIPETVHETLRQVIDSGMMTSGRCVRLLEEQLSGRLSGRHVVCVSSGTTAALLAFHMLCGAGVKRAILPDFLYPSIASAALRCGLNVEVVDIEPVTLSIDVNQVAQARPGPDTVVLSVDQFGIPGSGQELRDLCDRSGATWFEDAACALGAMDGDAPCGTLCDVSILSFHPRKVLTTGEGGALVMAAETLSRHARLLRDHGVGLADGRRVFLEPGYNARLSELHAAVGLAHLELFDEQLAWRARLGKLYLKLLAPLPVEVPAGYAGAGCNFQTLAVILPDAVDRQRLVDLMAAAGIETTVAGFAIHEQPAFAQVSRSGSLEFSDTLAARGLALPVHERMSLEDVQVVVETLEGILKEKA